MSKKLPYFQFEPAEYLTGNIQFCSLSAQGLFVNIKSIYWQRDCDLTKEHLDRIFNYPKLIEELIQENIIKINGEFVIIGFLDIQYEEITNRKKRLSIAGKKGAAIKKIKATLKPPLSQAKATLKQPDKIIEDKTIEIDSFWDLYHSYSKKSKTDLEPAKKHWKKLTEKEKQKAIDNTKKYINSINDKKYVVKARTYLSNKLFNNQFEDSYLKPIDKLVAHSALNVPALKLELIEKGYTEEEITKYAKQ